MPKSVGIVGAGIFGRLLALVLDQAGWRVRLFDQGDLQGTQSCSYAGAGMLSPYVELEKSEPVIARLGELSLELWPYFLKLLDRQIYFEQKGTVVVVHAAQQDELHRLRERLERVFPKTSVCEMVSGDQLRELEPELSEKFQAGLYFPKEGHVGSRHLLGVLGEVLAKKGIFHPKTGVSRVSSHAVVLDRETLTFDWVVDARGLGAQEQLKDLRGVRGELLCVQASEVKISRPIRLMHPRYPVYIVPRPDDMYLIGATVVESESLHPITVQSLLELLSAAYSVHSGFSEATLVNTSVQCRPAFPDHLPRMDVQEGLMVVNGLYRHGYLISPALVEMAKELIEGRSVPSAFESIVHRRLVA